MHLILGHAEDPCCSGVQARLAARGLPVRIVAMPLAPPSRLVLRIGTDGKPVQPGDALTLDDETTTQVGSVLVRANVGLDPAGWAPLDHAYVHAETQAALLAWLWALDCPVINRITAELWYRPRNPLLFWAPLLRRCGLPTPELVVTNNADVARDFRLRLEVDHVPGAVCTGLAREADWLVDADDWTGVAALQAHTPICLAEPHRGARSVCIVGRSLVWNTPQDQVEAGFEQSMLRFAAAAGLDFVELALARVRRGWAIVHVDPLPRLEHFGQHASSRILDALTSILVGDTHVAERLAEAAT